MIQNNNQFPPQYPNLDIMAGMSPFPQPPQYQRGIGGFSPFMAFPTFDPSPNTFNRNIFQRNNIPSQGVVYNKVGPTSKQRIYAYTTTSNSPEVVDMCSIQ